MRTRTAIAGIAGALILATSGVAYATVNGTDQNATYTPPTAPPDDTVGATRADYNGVALQEHRVTVQQTFNTTGCVVSVRNEGNWAKVDKLYPTDQPDSWVLVEYLRLPGDPALRLFGKHWIGTELPCR